LGLENFRFHLGVGLEIGNWKNSNALWGWKISVSTWAWGWKLEIGKYNLLRAWIISVSRQVGVEN